MVCIRPYFSIVASIRWNTEIQRPFSRYHIFLTILACSCRASQLGKDKPAPFCDADGECACPEGYSWDSSFGYCQKEGGGRCPKYFHDNFLT